MNEVNKARELRALMRRPESLSKEFPWNEALAEEKVFVNHDGSLGAVFKITLAEHETMVEDAVVSAVNSLKTWFSVPENAVLQVIFEQLPLSPLDKRLDQYTQRYLDGHPVSRFLFEQRIEAIRSSCGLGREGTPLERRAFLTVRWFPQGRSEAGLLSFYKGPSATLADEKVRADSELAEFLGFLRAFESNSQTKLTRLGGSDLLSVLRQFFNPEAFYRRRFAAYNSSVPLSEQIIYAAPTMDFGGIQREGVMTRTLSLKTSPSFAYPGGMAYFTSLNFPMRIALNFSFPGKQSVKKYLDLKEFFLENTPSARARRQKEEILEVQRRLVHDDRCVHLSFHVTIEGRTTEDLDRMTREVLNVFQNQLEAEAIVEGDIGGALALVSLPLFYDPRSDLSARRFIRILRSDAMKFLPIFDSFAGLNDPVQLYLSREQNIVKFSLLENETSQHTVVLADSGSGKSSFVIDAVAGMKRLSPEPLVFVIDKKSSYVSMADYYGADITVFSADGDMPFSPFRGIFDEEKVAFLTQLLAAGIRLMSPSFELESDHIAVLSKSVRLAHERKLREANLSLDGVELIASAEPQDTVLTMNDVVAEMAGLASLDSFEKLQPVVDVVVQKLSPFYGDGIYSRYFNAAPEKAKKSKKSKLFYIYDLDALDSDPILQNLMTMAVIEEIRQTIKQHRDSGRQGLVVLEELQMLGRGSTVGRQFVVDAAETFRKMGVWLISLTPRPQNYFETEVGKAMWGVADNYVFLQMSADNVDYVAAHSSMLDEAGIEIVKSLRTVRGSHADVFYVNKKRTRQGAFRFFQTPYDRWLAPTNAAAATAASAARAKYPTDRWKALEELVREHPLGLG